MGETLSKFILRARRRRAGGVFHFFSQRWSMVAGLAFLVGLLPATYLLKAGGGTSLRSLAGFGLLETEPPDTVMMAALVPDAPPLQDAEVAVPTEDVRTLTMGKAQTLYSLLRQEQVPGSEILALVGAAKAHLDLGRLRLGTTLRAVFSIESPHLLRLEVDISPVRLLIVKRTDSSRWECDKFDREIRRELVNFQGQVQSSLWASAVAAGVDFAVIQALTEVFAWQIDFSREVRPADRWRVAIERLFVDQEPIGWGEIRAAEYVNVNETFTALHFTDRNGRSGHYFPDGSSMKKMFLRSPMRFARISSAFNPERFHPILRRSVPHNGVDYAAAPGTPIRAVGDGVVEFAGVNGASGNHINVRHNAVYSTSYSHLQRFASGLRKGSRVEQGEVIGYVGSTGLATGPHLHFSFYENGRFVDPLGKKFPSADPVPDAEKAAFRQQSALAMGQLPTWTEALASTPAKNIRLKAEATTNEEGDSRVVIR